MKRVLGRIADDKLGHLCRNATRRATELSDEHGQRVVAETDPERGDVRFVFEQEEQ